MSLSVQSVPLIAGDSTTKTFLGALDSVTGNYSFGHPLIDGTSGALISPATQQTLASVLAALQTPLSPPPFVTTPVSFTRPADTTTYAVGDLVANSTTAGSVVPMLIAASRGNDIAGIINRCRLTKTSTGVTSTLPLFRAHLYSALPTPANGDNGVWSTSQAANYIGSMDITINKSFTDGATGIGTPTEGASLFFKPVSGTPNIYALLEARYAYTPTSAESFSLTLEVQ